jgi:hypothetical protein
LQVSRANHTSAASGVAYAETRGATNLLNWTEAGPKILLTSVGPRNRTRFSGTSAAHVLINGIPMQPFLTHSYLAQEKDEEERGRK